MSIIPIVFFFGFVFLIILAISKIRKDQSNGSMTTYVPLQIIDGDVTSVLQKKDPSMKYCCIRGDHSFKYKPLSKIESALNLGMENGRYALESLDYHDGQVVIRMRNGKTLMGLTCHMRASFFTFKGNLQCKLRLGNDSVEIYTIWHLFTNDEWWEIFSILSHCGEVEGLSSLIATEKLYNTTEGKVLRGAITVISHL